MKMKIYGWAASRAWRLFLQKKNPFRSFYSDEPRNKKLGHVRSISVLKNGDVLAGLRNGIARINALTNEFSITDEDHLYHHIYEDKERRVHVATQHGLFIYSDGKLMPVQHYYPEFKPYAMNPVNSHVFIGDSLVVLGTENDKGILVWNHKRHVVQNIDNSSVTPLTSNVVNSIYRDKDERLWVLSDHVISIVSRDFKKVIPLTIPDTSSKRNINLFFDMCEANGYYWIAAYGTGIIQLDTAFRVKRIFNTQSGLSDNGVYQVFHANDKLVVTSDNGLSVFDLNTLKFKRYYQEDGLHSNSFEEVAGMMKDGLIYAGGVKGFTIIDPSKFTTNTTPPKVYINRIFVDRADKSTDIDTTNLELKELNVPNDVLQTTLYFSGINYSNPERTTFAYRITEKSTDWISIGNQNYINLIGLSPGTYHFEVKAANEDDVWSQPVTLTLRYLPKWYQTWYFKMLLVLIAVGLGYAIYRIRISQIMRQQKIRRDVASDLHDDIGSSLNSVKLFAHLAKGNPAQQEYITNIEDNLEQATIGLRDMIWILDDKRDSVSDLFDRLRQFSAKPAEAIGIEVHFSIADGLQNTTLSKPVKRNLFLVVKESINNSVKYSGCRNIWVTVGMQSKKLRLTVKDDGKGFDDSAATEGYGLTNIKSRANQINFDCRIKSDKSGTEITVTEK